MLAEKSLQHAPLSSETSKHAERKPCGLLNGWNKNLGTWSTETLTKSVTVRKSLHLLVLQSY